ncbi:MAG: GTP 3',8-cyclase MoaA [Promethearchaeota archaeon]
MEANNHIKDNFDEILKKRLNTNYEANKSELIYKKSANKILVDKFNRKITKLRISITSICNLNCIYCHREGHNSLNKADFLTLEQISKIADICNKFGINTVKITGGEPLLHPKIVEIVKIFAEKPNITDVSLTTNGTKLESLCFQLKNAGLNRINIGCDSIRNTSIKNLNKIEKGIFVAKKAGINPIKLNMVVLKGINENEINDLINYCKKNSLILQLIELIDFNPDFYKKYHLELSSIEESLKERSKKIIKRDIQDRNQYILENGAIVEVVKPMHNAHFCANCSTIRVTADYQFKPCLKREDNLVPIGNDIEESLFKAIKARAPFFTTK